MPPTIDYRETVIELARCDPEFREGLLVEGVQCLLGGEIDVATIILRDYIETTMGYEKLGKLTGAPAKKLAFMFENEATATASDLFKVVIHIQRHEGIQFEVKAVPAETAAEDEAELEAVPETAAAR